MIQIRPDVRRLFADLRSVEDFLRLECAVKRRFKNRHTGRFVRDGKAFFIKGHDRAGWWAVLDELLHLRAPHLGAGHEKRAIERVTELGVPTMTIAAYGHEGALPPFQRSFIITDEIRNAVSLEDLCRRWRDHPPDPRFKRRLIHAVADIARRLHQGGVNHRDFYLCHFLLPTGQESQRRPRLILIDLHRAQVRSVTPRRWVVKDLAGLYFSALDTGLTRRDLQRFIRAYRGRSWRDDPRFWRSIQKRAEALYRKEFRRPPPPLAPDV